MREKWEGMTAYRRVMLLATVAVLAVFAVLYPIVSRQKGLEYRNDFYKLKVQGDAKVYSGIDHGRGFFTSAPAGEGKKTVYTVTETPEGYKVECRIEGQDFGPYQVSEIPLFTLPVAFIHIPMNGKLEIKNTATGELLFRGGYYSSWPDIHLISENVKTEADAAVDKTYQMTLNGVTLYDYRPVTPAEGPGPYDLVHFTLGDEEGLTHKGDMMYFGFGLLVAVLNMVLIVYAEELFVWEMSFRVTRPEEVEPSEWELFSRHLGWGLFLLMELILFIVGLSATA